MSNTTQQTSTVPAQAPLAQPQPSSGGGLQSTQLLGSKLSIITTVQIRYEGILSAVDPVNKSMTLVQVKQFGSEGRRNGVNEIPASDTDINEVTFKIEHIKDFRIVEKPNTILVDPAIISSSTTT